MAICDYPLVLPKVASRGRAATTPRLFQKKRGSGGPVMTIIWYFLKARATSRPFPERGAWGGQAVTTLWLSPKGRVGGVNPLALPIARGEGRESGDNRQGGSGQGQPLGSSQRKAHTETTTLALSEGKDQWRINGDDPLAPPSSKG